MESPSEFQTRDERETRALGARFARIWGPGDVVFLLGNLGAGKTTFVRGLLEEFGWTDAVRSPTFNLVHEYPTVPPVVHADLYRVAGASGLGLEDREETHLILIEWPDRARDVFPEEEAWRVEITSIGDERRFTVTPPERAK